MTVGRHSYRVDARGTTRSYKVTADARRTLPSSQTPHCK